MITHKTSYFFATRKWPLPSWPPDELARFERYRVGEFGEYEFEPDPVEADFIEECRRHPLASDIFRKSVSEVGVDDLASTADAWTSFAVDELKVGRKQNDVWSIFLPGCPECRHGMRQIHRLSLDPTLSERQDIGYIVYVPTYLYIVNARTKEMIERIGLTGCEFIPCLRSDLEYSDQDRLLNGNSELVSANAVHFQLNLTNRMQVERGKIVYDTRLDACQTCKSVRLYQSHLVDGSPLVIDRPISPGDFQYYDEVRTPEETIGLMSRSSLVSCRALSILLSSKLKGLNRQWNTYQLLLPADRR